MKKLLIGTTNIAKFNDYKQLLKDFPLEVVSLYEFNIKQPKETGKDFEENAVLKSRYYFEQTGIPTLSDDGGFEIHALGGEPGVKSHRWLGRTSSDDELIDMVYKKIKKIPEDKRHCSLRTVVAVASPYGVMTSQGSVDGVIAPQPSKKRIKGYPFRSVMYLPNYKKHFADMTRKELDIMNHRKAAVDKIKDIFFVLSN